MSLNTNIYYDVYLATDIQGPWTKQTGSPQLDVATGNHYTITGLTNGQLYYIMVVAGKYDNEGNFVTIGGQPIIEASSPGLTGAVNPNIIAAKPMVIPNGSNGTLGFSIQITHN